jgi:diguanylate cyclase (GGDEF)-like protein
VLVLLLASLASTAPGWAAAEKKLPTLTTAHAAHDISSVEAARGYPVHLRAVVTYYDPNLGHGYSALFVNDETGGIYVRVPADTIPSLPPGTLIDVRGVSANGSFAPYVVSPVIRILGTTHLPENAVRVTYASLFSGVDDGKWVEVDGVIHSYDEVGHAVTLQLAMADGLISVIMVKEPGADYSSLIDAKVRIHANTAPLLSRIKFQMIGARLMAPGMSAIKVLEPAPKDPFNEPVIPADNLLQWDQVSAVNHRVHLRGTVTLQRPGSSLCIHDSSGAVCAQTTQDTPLAVGDVADVAGFAAVEGEAHVLTDAAYKRVGSGKPVAAEPLTPEEVLSGVHSAQLIQVEGQLIGRDLASSDTTLMLSSGNYIFPAILPKKLTGADTSAWKTGSKLRVTGICSIRLDVEKSAVGEGIAVARSFRILLRSPDDMAVLQKPSWWTPDHAAVVLALALTGTLLVLFWVMVLRRRMERQTMQMREQAELLQEQTVLLRESEERFRHLALHDGLTGLATRLLLQDRIDVAMESARRHQTGLALLMMDLDKFKEINDTFGHQAGDEVLRVTANRLLESVRKSDTVARIGGDEFVVLFPELSDPQIAERTAVNMVKTLALPISYEGRELPVSVSIGVCVASGEELDADALLKNADAALYRAKARGRGCFEVHSSNAALAQTEAPAGQSFG